MVIRKIIFNQIVVLQFIYKVLLRYIEENHSQSIQKYYSFEIFKIVENVKINNQSIFS